MTRDPVQTDVDSIDRAERTGIVPCARCGTPYPLAGDCPQCSRPTMPAPLNQQLDLDGGRHEIAPATERMRLFDPAPAQLAGQTYLDVDNPNGRTDNE